jgi:hypothetical protein
MILVILVIHMVAEKVSSNGHEEDVDRAEKTCLCVWPVTVRSVDASLPRPQSDK